MGADLSPQALEQNQSGKHDFNLSISSPFSQPVNRFPFSFLEQQRFRSLGQGREDPYLAKKKKKKSSFKQSKNFRRNSGRLNPRQEGREEWEANKWHAPQVYEYLNYISLKKLYITASYLK